MLEVKGIITRGIRKLAKAHDISVCVPPPFDVPSKRRCAYLAVIENGDTRSLRISHKVAEVLIAQGIAWQG